MSLSYSYCQDDLYSLDDNLYEMANHVNNSNAIVNSAYPCQKITKPKPVKNKKPLKCQKCKDLIIQINCLENTKQILLSILIGIFAIILFDLLS